MAVSEGGKKCPIVGMIKNNGDGKGGLYHRNGKAGPEVGSIMEIEKLSQRWLYHSGGKAWLGGVKSKFS